MIDREWTRQQPTQTWWEDSTYQYIGDYIFDSSSPDIYLSYGVPKGLQGKTQLMSDHLLIGSFCHCAYMGHEYGSIVNGSFLRG